MVKLHPVFKSILYLSICQLFAISTIYIYPILITNYPSIGNLSTCRNIQPVDLQRYGVLVFWMFTIPCAIFLYYDYIYDKNNTLALYRIQCPGRKAINKLNWNLYSKAMYLSVRNSVFCSLNYITFILPRLFYYRRMCHHFWFENYSYLDILIFIIIKIPMLLLITDVYFYIIHRLFHEYQYLYKNVHKIHHEFVDTMASAAGAAHWIEHCIVNLGAASFPSILLGTPIGFAYLWMAFATLNGVCSHSGYNLYLSLGAIPHDFHHHFQDVVFGAGGYCDKLFASRMIDKYKKQWTKFNDGAKESKVF